MTAETGYFPVPEWGSIFYSHWSPEGDARALVLIVHGLAEHCLRYERLAEYLNGQGYAVCALDLPGHGQSDGTRCFVNSFDDNLNAVLGLRDKIAAQYPHRPVILLGHSMGGLVSTRLVQRSQEGFAALVLSAPALATPQEPSALLKYVVRLLSKLMPKLGVLQLDSKGVSRDTAVVEDYVADPLNHNGKVPARTVAEMFAAMAASIAAASEVKLPLLLMHGEADSMTSVSGSQSLYDAAAAPDKSLRVYPELYHEIFNEPEWEQVYSDLLAWLNQRF
ncbi:alpha/beta hydrolase [Halieaceae bacterium IMCC14734]|uniref:Alpha/beta hydrolase n=1 Tax=Candidatus Litorirhabdus singularis TaxID=2518993 RepID=A0ABT3TL82_9GAMM|nr:lysophospholipase [Candidatus Litorirhabdus singularis]MCX2983063.1 alpha/beta hydrolase [Candidatus Litorirhabdus singularis]